MDRIARMKLPAWLRIVLVASALILVAGASFLSYRWYARPTTLTIAVGSLDGEATKLVSALASRLAAMNARVRLTVKDVPGTLEAAEMFSAGTTDLAVVRGDVGDLSQAQAVIVLAHAVVLLVAPPGSPITDMAGLKRITVGVVGGDNNRKVVRALTDEYDLGRANVTFKNLAPSEARRALDSKEVRVILAVVPLAEKYLSLLRGLFPQSPKSSPVLIPVESAGAIAEKERAFESFDVPKGTLRGSPANPAEDLTTLRVSFYLVARKTLDNDLVTDFTEDLMKARRDLLGELPILAQATAPSTDPDAYLPVHPGAAAFYNGTQQTFLDKWGNAIFLTPMVLGGLASVLAAAWKFLRPEEAESREAALDTLYALGRRIRTCGKVTELSEIEGEIDRTLEAQRGRAAVGDENALDVATLNVAAHRLENLIHDRRIFLASQQEGRPDLEKVSVPKP
jgi:TRAP-type uncharacterized transport system substrate-binding protein